MHRAQDVEVSVAARLAWVDGQRLQLTAKEFDLLCVLVCNAGCVVSREYLMREVWRTSFWTSTRTIDTHVGWLRRKLGDDPRDPRLITTVRGYGLRFETAATARQPRHGVAEIAPASAALTPQSKPTFFRKRFAGDAG